MNVLIIEDDPRIAEINRRFVEKVPGYQVIGIATDEGQAKEQLEVLRPELVLLDIFFPDMNGLDLLRYIQENHRETDVIIITAAKEVETVREAIRGGVFDFIVKPMVFDRFQKTLLKYQEYRRKFDRIKADGSQINQEEIDLLIHSVGQKSTKDAYLPKGIDKLTLEKVSAVLIQTRQDLTAEAMAKEIGASRSTARRYLEYLVSQGQALADLSYGVGRPERVYRAT
ncbi:MAG: response regulator [Tumebacillaceae bacterium]